MSYLAERDDHDFEPLAWVRGQPVYVTTLLVVLHVAMLVVFSLASASGFRAQMVDGFLLSSAKVLGEGELWRLVSYYFAQPPVNPIFFALEMYLLFVFGREVEKYLGRRRFILLVAVLVAVPAVLLTLLGLVIPTVLIGSHTVHFALFIAFATLYPHVEFFLRIQARWLALGFLGLIGLYYLSSHNWSSFCAFFGDAVAAWFFILRLRGQWPAWVEEWLEERSRHREERRPPPSSVSSASRSRPGPLSPSASRQAAARASSAPPTLEEDPMAAIDPLLDKIATEGLASLTSEERDRLEEAREALLNRPPR